LGRLTKLITDGNAACDPADSANGTAPPALDGQNRGGK
jgi:hypothetical protein